MGDVSGVVSSTADMTRRWHPPRPIPTLAFLAETPLEVGNRFEVSQSGCGMLPRLQPLLDCALRIAGSRQMVRKQLRLALDEIDEMLFQHRRDACV